MSEQGSDAQFADLADTDAMLDAVQADDAARAAEEQRVSTQTDTLEEPGDQYPDPDQAPPPDEPHDEYDPTPPA
jgi:hypothetical protein